MHVAHADIIIINNITFESYFVIIKLQMIDKI